MKKKLVLITLLMMLLCLIVWRAVAGVIVLVGSGVTIGANQTTNFTAVAQIGTFNLSPQYLYLTLGNGITNNAQVFIYGNLTFDGTNVFRIAQQYTFTTTNPVSGAQWAVTNISLPVYGMLSVSNGMSGVVSNFSAQIQF